MVKEDTKDLSVVRPNYLVQVKNAPILSLEQEQQLVQRKHQDQNAAHQLIISHLRLVYKVASAYKSYGIPVYELFSEGVIGLIHAVRKFNPEKGVRLATYAMFWIKAAIQEYILHSWSLVKISSSATHKKLFFNLNRLKNELKIKPNTELSISQAQMIANALGMQQKDVINMNHRFILSDQSLNSQIVCDSHEEKVNFVSDGQILEDQILENDELNYRKQIVLSILAQLSERERNIFIARHMMGKAITLSELSKRYNLSQERIRQIEAATFKKIYKQIQENYLTVPQLL